MCSWAFTWHEELKIIKYSFPCLSLACIEFARFYRNTGSTQNVFQYITCVDTTHRDRRNMVILIYISNVDWGSRWPVFIICSSLIYVLSNLLAVVNLNTKNVFQVSMYRFKFWLQCFNLILKRPPRCSDLNLAHQASLQFDFNQSKSRKRTYYLPWFGCFSFDPWVIRYISFTTQA